MPSPPSILFIGSLDNADGAPAVSDGQFLSGARCAGSIAAAIDLVTDSDIEPELIVLGRSRPGDFRASQMMLLRRAAPLARIVELLGPWCDGELRTGQPLAGTIRVACHQWPAWQRRELLHGGGQVLPVWALPVTASDEERLLAQPSARVNGAGLIAICGSDTDSSGWLAAICQSAGYSTTELPAAHNTCVANASSGVWSAAVRNAAVWRNLADFVAAIAPAPVVCVLGFPRPEEIEYAAKLGAGQVLAQPLLIDDLLSSLRLLIARHDEIKHSATCKPPPLV